MTTAAGALSKARLQRMHDVMAGYVDRGEVPGLVMLVCHRGEVHADAIGTLAARDAGPLAAPVRRDSIFRISSMTKPVIAVAAMILVEECKLRLDDPVDGLLPELAGRRVLRRLDGPLDDTVLARRPITLRDLLTFRMGLGIIMAPPDTYPIQRAMTELGLMQGPPRPAKTPPPDEWMRRLGTLPLVHQPCERWMYNTGSDVLGVLVARAARQPLGTFLRERLFEPLAMKDTYFSVPPAKIERFATQYAPRAPGPPPVPAGLEVYDPAEGGEWSRPPAFPSGSAGLVSTADDYLAFGLMLLNGGEHGRVRLLSRPSVETMTCDQLQPEHKAGAALVPGYFDSHGWGFGLSVVTRREDPAEPIDRFGWDGGLGTSWYADPREELTTILMTQVNWTSPRPPPICRDFWTLAYAALAD